MPDAQCNQIIESYERTKEKRTIGSPDANGLTPALFQQVGQVLVRCYHHLKAVRSWSLWTSPYPLSGHHIQQADLMCNDGGTQDVNQGSLIIVVLKSVSCSDATVDFTVSSLEPRRSSSKSKSDCRVFLRRENHV